MASGQRWTGAAITLVVFGLLIFIPSGLCTGVVGIAGLFSLSQAQGYGVAALIAAVIVGGPFIVLGALLIRTGLRERHRT